MGQCQLSGHRTEGIPCACDGCWCGLRMGLAKRNAIVCMEDFVAHGVNVLEVRTVGDRQVRE